MVLKLVPCSDEEPIMCVGISRVYHVAGMFHEHFSVCKHSFHYCGKYLKSKNICFEKHIYIGT